LKKSRAEIGDRPARRAGGNASRAGEGAAGAKSAIAPAGAEVLAPTLKSDTAREPLGQRRSRPEVAPAVRRSSFQFRFLSAARRNGRLTAAVLLVAVGCTPPPRTRRRRCRPRERALRASSGLRQRASPSVRPRPLGRGRPLRPGRRPRRDSGEARPAAWLRHMPGHRGEVGR